MSDALSWRVVAMGEGALLVEASPSTSGANRAVLALAGLVEAAALPAVEALVPAINSLLISFDPLRLTADTLQARVLSLAATLAPQAEQPTRVVEIAVRYGGADGPDIEEVATLLALRPAQVVAHHCAPTYHVMMVGFAPGFPYLGPLPAALQLPRRSTPRIAVPAGSVAIAANLSGIYPSRLPGGWHLIGRTERVLFDPAADPPALLAAGDGVRFVPLADGVMPCELP